MTLTDLTQAGLKLISSSAKFFRIVNGADDEMVVVEEGPPIPSVRKFMEDFKNDPDNKGPKGDEGDEGPVGPPLTAIVLEDVPDETTPGLAGQHGHFGQRVFEKLSGEDTGWIELPSLDEDGLMRTEQFPEVVIVKVREGTTAELAAADPPLLPSEPAFDTTTGRLQMGDVPYAKLAESERLNVLKGSTDPLGYDEYYVEIEGEAQFENGPSQGSFGFSSQFFEFGGRARTSVLTRTEDNDDYSDTRLHAAVALFRNGQWQILYAIGEWGGSSVSFPYILENGSVVATAPDDSSYFPPYFAGGGFNTYITGTPPTFGKEGQMYRNTSNSGIFLQSEVPPSIIWTKLN